MHTSIVQEEQEGSEALLVQIVWSNRFRCRMRRSLKSSPRQASGIVVPPDVSDAAYHALVAERYRHSSVEIRWCV